MKRSAAKALSVLTWVIALVLALFNSGDDASVFLIVLAAAIVWCILGLFLRCPACGRLPGRSWLWAQYCPYCGEPLDD